VIFALVAQRALEPGSKLACTTWVAQRVFVEHLPGFSDDQAYRAMDFLLDALEGIAAEVFASVATLLNLDVDLVFVDSPAQGYPSNRTCAYVSLIAPNISWSADLRATTCASRAVEVRSDGYPHSG